MCVQVCDHCGSCRNAFTKFPSHVGTLPCFCIDSDHSDISSSQWGNHSPHAGISWMGMKLPRAAWKALEYSSQCARCQGQVWAQYHELSRTRGSFIFQSNVLNQTPGLCSSAGIAISHALAMQRFTITITPSPSTELATSPVLSATPQPKSNTVPDLGPWYIQQRTRPTQWHVN